MISKGSLIIIDDEESVLDIIENFFEKRGLKVYRALDGAEARDILSSNECEVALIDLKLPDCSGLDLIEEFNEKYPELKCVIMTAFASVESTISALRHNVFDYVQKPFDLVKIGEIVEAAHTSYAQRGENRRTIEELEESNRKLELSREKLNRKVVESNEKLARVNESLKAHVTRLKMLYQMGRDISSNENWDDALDRFLMALCKYLQAEGAGILLFSKGGKELKPRTSYHVADEFLKEAVARLLQAQQRDLIQPEIFCLKDCEKRIVTCLASEQGWDNTVVPLVFKGKWLGFLLVMKSYRSRMNYLHDYHFINTIQTIFTEEVANAVNISRLRNLKNFNETILENINSGVLKTDKKGKIIFLNSKAKDLIGGGYFDGMSFDDLFRSGASAESLFSKLTDNQNPSFSFEEEIKVGEDRSIPVKINSKVVKTDEYTGKTIVAVFEDLSRQKAVERELRRADRLRSLGELSAGVAHEIRNPLTGIATTAQVLSEKLKGREEDVKYISVILSEINRLDDIIRNLLDFARPAAPKLSRVSLQETVRSCIELIGKNADNHGVKINIYIEADDDTCIVDADQIKQVFINISKNAIEACKGGGRIDIRLKDSDDSDYLKIEFSDTGRGIDDDISDKLYDPFFTTNPDGSGLGLSISRKIIESHRGRISHRSDPGEGTSFIIELPRSSFSRSKVGQEEKVN